MIHTALSRSGLRRVLVVLCVTEVTSWGVLFYAFPVLLTDIAAATGWSPSAMTAAFSVGLITSALAGIPVGRLLDRLGPRPVMTAGAVLAAPAVALVAVAGSLPWFFAGWFLIGVAMSGVLYAPAFAALTRWWGPRRIVALTAVTLAGGLASTVFAPLTALLAGRLDWRGTYLVLAGLLAVITVPLHAFGLRGPWPHPVSEPDERPTEAPDRITRSRAFVMLAVTLTMASFTLYGAVIILVPLLLERGMSTGAAALALGLGGIGQVCGRMGYGWLTGATSVRARTAIVLGAGAASIVLLGLLPGPALLLVAGAMLAGATRGVFTLLQATAVTDRWGAANYGRLNGLLGAPILVTTALAPWACTALAGLVGGYPTVFVLLGVLTVVAAVLATAYTLPAEPAAQQVRSPIETSERDALNRPAR